MHEFSGKLLYVNLTTRQIHTEPLNTEWAAQFIGADGLATRYLFDMVDADTDPLSPDNPLIMMTAPLTGTRTPSASRHAFVAKSPLTGILGESNVGGFTGHELRRAGYDGIIFTGKAAEPVYLHLQPGREPALKSAVHLWGMDTYRTQSAIIEASGDPKTRVACIGPAGENLVHFAAIANADARMAGRTGMGAVMGSKNLKAIAIRGKGEIPVSDREAMTAAFRKSMAVIQSDLAIEVLKDLGTAGGLEFFDMMGSLPGKYWTVGENPGAYNLSGAAMADSILTGRTGCWGCAVQCGREVTFDVDGESLTTDGPEYECVVSLGSNLLIDDLNAVSRFDFICDAMGMDVITAGAVIGFAIYLSDQKIISPAETDGMALTWGNPQQVITLLEKITRREGVGNLLADGVRAMERAFNAPGLGVQINGMDPGMHDPRGFSGMALVYLTSPRGACHNKSDFYFVEMGHTFETIGISVDDQHQEDGKAPFVVWHQNYRAMVDASGMCKFVNIPLDVLPDTLAAVTGKRMSLDEWVLAGERIFNLKRLLNLKLGMVPRRDEVMPKLFTVPYAAGATNGFVPNWKRMLREYYAVRDWDWDTGRPSAAKLAELGLAALE